ncbi:hypothetical protein GOV03_04250 [Candidatus Woesearchaeota archaeon]|nr:hypothetical protein [Candidatus Woesearchaeota archaeon]
MMKLSMHWGLHKIVVGGLLLLNAFIWPMWLGVDGWIKFIAVLMVLGGAIKLIHPMGYPCCGAPVAKNVKKKRKK